MSTISASTTSTTAYKVTADTTGTLVLQTGSTPTTAMTIDTSQNVGIGTSSPSGRFEIYSDANSAQQSYVRNVNAGSGAYSVFNVGNDSSATAFRMLAASSTATAFGGADSANLVNSRNSPMTFWTNNTERMRIDSSGNVGIGTSSTSGYKLAVSDGTTYSVVHAGGGASYYGAITNNPVLFITNNAERMRIDSSGNLLVGGTTNGGARFLVQRSDSAVVGRFYATASSGYTSDVLQAISTQGSNTSSTIFGAYYGDGAAFAFRVRGDGTIYAQNTTVQSASDARFKENIVDSTEGLNVVSALRPVRFDIMEGHGVSAKTNQLGFIAQEVQAVFPDAVDVWKESDDPENPYLSLGSTALIPVLVKAIQEQQALITQLQADIEALKAK